ncbi:MAG: sigma-70 family RNA polymerase sigma factor [Candidatus Micrarchaeota archaeon]
MPITVKKNSPSKKGKRPTRRVSQKTVRWQQVYLKNAALIRSVANKVLEAHLVLLRANGVDLEDLCQIGAIAMDRASEKFDKSRGTRFGTYAYSVVQKALGDEVTRCKRLKRSAIPVSLNQSRAEKQPSEESDEQKYASVPDTRKLIHRPSELSDPKIRANLARIIRNLVISGEIKGRLSIRQRRELVLDRFGLLDGHVYTQNELAEKYSVVPITVFRILERTFKMLQKDPQMQKYAGFVIGK